MKKLILLILLVSAPAFAEVRVSGTATSAFIDNTAGTVEWTRFQGRKVIAVDTSDRKAIGYVGTANTGLFTEPDLHTSANAASDKNGEASGTTGWTNSGLATFESQGVIVNTGSYALHAVVDSANDLFYSDLNSWGLVTGTQYILTFSWRHAGATVGSAGCYLGPDSSGIGGTNVGSLSQGDTSFLYVSKTFTHTVDTRYLTFRETGSDDNADFYVDNISIQKYSTELTGCSVYSTPGLSTNSFTSQDSGFDTSNVDHIKIKDPATEGRVIKRWRYYR